MKRKIKRLFLPLKRSIRIHDKKREPSFLKTRSMLLVFLFVVFIEFLFLANHVGRISFEHLLASIVPEKLIELTNIRRGDDGLETLAFNPLLKSAAKMKAEDMASKGYFAHTSPEGLTPWYWFDKVGYNYLYAGENLAVNFTENYKIDEAWMKSPTHRDNILSERFEEIGIATAVGEYKGKEAVFVVQLFGKRLKDESFIPEVIELEEVIIEIGDEGESILGEEAEKEEFAKEELEEKEKEPKEKEEAVLVKDAIIEEEKEEKETFAFIEKTENQSLYTVGNPSSIISVNKEPIEYVTFWGRIASSPSRSAGYLIIIMTVIFSFTLFLKLLMMKRIYLTFTIVNELVILFIIFSAILVSHVVLSSANYIF
jgi:hypothetical protein